jgi:hypothetical protein
MNEFKKNRARRGAKPPGKFEARAERVAFRSGLSEFENLIDFRNGAPGFAAIKQTVPGFAADLDAPVSLGLAAALPVHNRRAGEQLGPVKDLRPFVQAGLIPPGSKSFAALTECQRQLVLAATEVALRRMLTGKATNARISILATLARWGSQFYEARHHVGQCEQCQEALNQVPQKDER